MRYKYVEGTIMKKILLAVSLVICSSAFANPYHYGHGHGHHHGHWRYYGGGWNWVVPAIIGGAIVYEATRPPVVVQQPPVVVQQPPVVVQPQQQNCSPWTETQNSDGTITRTRTCNQ